MPVSLNNTQVVFNDASTQTTAGVTSVSAGTGISVAGGLTPTVTNTGVTSVAAGTGITVSASTGGVTISASGGGVTSLNGQTGVITSTNIDSIGATIAAVHAVTALNNRTQQTLQQNDTVAGSALRRNYNIPNSNDPFRPTNSTDVGGNVSIAYNQGGTALTGTWRCTGRNVGYTNQLFGDPLSRATWTPGMFVRIS
jgi:hypothetical protein